MPDYRIDFNMAGEQINITESPEEIDAADLFALGDSVAAQRAGNGWPGYEVSGVYRTDIGTPVERPES